MDSNNTKEVSTLNYDKLEKMAQEHNDTSIRIPILRINYDNSSKYPLGCWVVGQTKGSDGNIIDQGSKVSKIVILKVRGKYTYIDLKNPKNNCVSPLFKKNESVEGHKYKNVCGKSCPYRNPDNQLRCKANRVVFAIAITDDKKHIDCMAYIKGTSYMPFEDYCKEAEILKNGDKTIKIPLFSFITCLGSVLTKNKMGGKDYYVIKFEKGNLLSQHSIDVLDEKAKKLETVIDQLNSFSQNVYDAEEDPDQSENITGNEKAVKTKTEEKIEFFQQSQSVSEIVDVDESELFK